MEDDFPKLYSTLAEWFPVLTPPEEYVDEAALYRRLILQAAPHATQVLELGSGGGNNASHMKAHFEMTLVDLSEDMLAISRRMNPECAHLQGDMRTVRLGQEFDAVFIHDAVAYITTEDDLDSVVETAFVHCREGGVVLLVPDYVKERFRPTTDHGGTDRAERSMRYLEWDWDPDPNDSTFLVDFAYILREADGSVRVVHDRHVCGLFPRATWISLLEKRGFAVEVRVDESQELQGTEVFVARRPDAGTSS